jgi:hypothetical protein
MLEIVGHPVAVNPDAELRVIAEELGSEIRRFESVVTLRDKLAAKAPGAAVVTGVAAVLTYWALKVRRGSR